MAISLPVQLQISLNARLFKIFNIRDNRTFTIAHLRKTLGASFHISHEKIRFNLVSGRYTRDSDALFDLRASDGNSASLDVELPPAYIHSSLSNGVISLRFLSNACPVALQDVFCDGIVEVQDPSSSPRMPPSTSTAPLPFSSEELSREQRIAIRAQLEDPFSIASRSCFEDDSDDDEDYNGSNDGSDDDVDDDLYSDDGEAVFESASSESDCSSTPSSLLSSPVTSPTSSSFWPSDPNKLNAGHLRHLLSIATPRDSRREVILRVTLLRYSFQQTILQRLQDGPALIPSRSLENLKLTPAPPSAPVLTPSTTLPTKTASRDNSSC
ncbi:hypothetical protein MJO28_001709 [Puccinia striiformis f. sp. tritici]|uniref:Uncharacterized protein n=1 Tax=Puccinia striiformis f. sp. tritici TaxID=168172 RepID=A0ACC0EUR8_9BASI|nr:hypothetical protein Pst134EA_003050 [Puccinia striiformis f. sp. tritici]KAH9472436.1 hypothetical protein Pst134EA_003050 [Puccinia striiformis f. sp. tritici]KAI7961220.1 hypothetical protein MJO28_001709 [Puccinia striiformis f. sp. tritici]KAI9620447.1 hypothetical protein H4Q26_013659 [Puccinia striiformis f. sp. tritici PST-130]